MTSPTLLPASSNKPSSPTASSGGGGGAASLLGSERGRKQSFWSLEPFGELLNNPEDSETVKILETLTLGDFVKTGTLYKKRGGFFRNMPQQNWVPRTFGLTRKGVLLYYEDATIQEAAASAGGLGAPRQLLDLTKEGCTWLTPSNETDGHTKYMLLVTHQEKSVDHGQRLKLCANTEAELLGWVKEISPFCKEDDKVERPGAALRLGSFDFVPGSGRGGRAGGNRRRTRSTSLRRSGGRGGGGGGGGGGAKTSARGRAGEAGLLGVAGGFGEVLGLLVCVNACLACVYLADRTSQRGFFATCLPAVALANAAAVAALLRASDRARHMAELKMGLSVGGLEGEGAAAGGALGGGGGGGDEDGGLSGCGGGGGEGGSGSAGGGLPTKVVKPGQSIKRLLPSEGGGADDAAAAASSSSSSSSSTAEAATKPEMPSFGVGNSSDFELRTVGYKKHGVKAASAEPLYELVALDIFKTGRRVDRIHANLDLEGLDLPDTAHPDVPALFVMNVQFPREEQKMFTDGDGPGASVVFYFKITAATLTELQGPSSERSNALKLLTEWCRVAPEDPAFRGRFKAMGFIDRIQDYGLPGVAARFNGKPILIKKTGSLFRGQVGHAGMIEMDVNVHRFAYATRSCLIAMKEKFGSMVIKVGFTIEGREDDELPEVLLGCANINGVDLDAAIDLF